MGKWYNKELLSIRLQFKSGILKEYWIPSDEYTPLLIHLETYNKNRVANWQLTYYIFEKSDPNDHTFMHDYINFDNVEVMTKLPGYTYIRQEKDEDEQTTESGPVPAKKVGRRRVKKD